MRSRSEQEIRALRDTVMARHRTVDVVFNNGLARHGGDLRRTTAAEFEASLQVNATGLMLACQLFSEPMQERRSGSTVNIGSIYGSVSPDLSLYEGMQAGNRIDYAFVKGGMLNLTRYAGVLPGALWRSRELPFAGRHSNAKSPSHIRQ